MAGTETQVTLNGKTFELKGMSAEDGAKLYDELTKLNAKANYKDLADTYAGLARNFKSIESFKLPEGVDYQKFVNGFMKAYREGKNELSQEYKEFARTELGGHIVHSGVWKTAESAASFAEASASFINGFFRPGRTLLATAGAVTGTVGELWNQAGFDISDAQAKAIGAAYAAAFYMQSEAPDGPAETRRREPTWVDKAIAKVRTVFNDLWRQLPPEWTAYLGAVGHYISNGFKDWNGAYTLALKEAKEDRAQPALTYEQTLAKQVEESIDKANRPQAAKLLRSAEMIAGVNTQALADGIENGGMTYRGQDGAFYSLNFENGRPKTETLKDGKGNALTMGRRVLHQLEEVKHAAVPEDRYDALGYAAGLAVTTAVERTRLAPLRHSWNGVMHAFGTAVTVPADLLMGGLSGAAKGTASLVTKILPSSAGPEKLLRANADAVDAAGKAAEEAALKAAKKADIEGDALNKMVEEARDAARSDAAKNATRARGAFSRSLDGMRSWGDKARNLGARVEGVMASGSNLMHEFVGVAKDKMLFDTRTVEKKAADAAVKAAQGIINEAVENAPKTAKPTFGERFSAWKDNVFGGSGATATATQQAAQEAAKKTVEKVAEEGAKAVEITVKVAEEVGKVGKLFKLASGIGKLVPGVGLLFAGSSVFFSASAHADVVDGKKLSYSEQLDHDRNLGKVSAKEYAYYRGLQTAYIAAGAGGFITTGVTEAAQNGLEYADPVKMDKYLPESLVATVKGLVSGEKPTGVLPANPALSAAAVEATQKAERARVAAAAAKAPEVVLSARMATNRGMAFANVHSAEQVGVVRLQDGLPTGNMASAEAAASLPAMA